MVAGGSPGRIDASEGWRRTRSIQRGFQRCTAAAAIEHARHFTAEADRVAPRDTNRYLRGWHMAGRDVGVWGAVVATRASARRELIIDRLERQVEKFEKWVDVYEERAEEKRRLVDLWFSSKGRKMTPAGRRMLREAAKFEAQAVKFRALVLRAEEELAKYQGAEDAIVVYASRSKRARGGAAADGTVRKSRRRRLTTVRDKVYGGEGRMIRSGDSGTYVVLHNKEFHGTFVEKRHGTVAKARSAAVTQTPAKRVSLKALEASVKRDGFTL